jgi:U3 small nucleolar RNA-associated protein 21
MIVQDSSHTININTESFPKEEAQSLSQKKRIRDRIDTSCLPNKSLINNEDHVNSLSDDEELKKLNLNYSVNYSANIQSRLIEPFRSLGLVVDYNECQIFKRNTDRFLLASNYHSFLLYNLDKIKLERISPPLPNRITAVCEYKNKVFTATENKILLWEKIHIIKEYKNTSNITSITYIYKQLLTFDNLLLAISSLGDLDLFDIYSGRLIKSLPLRIDILVHPMTYLNKVLFTKLRETYEDQLDLQTAKLFLYNINTEKQIFEYDFGIGSQIRVIRNSPVIDLVGLGFSSGEIIIFNLRSLKKILTFKSENVVDSLAFSNCVEMNLSLLASGNPNGDINLWDLNKGSLHYTIRGRRNRPNSPNSLNSLNSANSEFSAVSSLDFLPGEPILIATSGKDNSIKMFSVESGLPSLLKSRAGHSSHPHKIRFYSENTNKESFHILSMADEEFRNISLLNEHMSREFSFSLKSLPNEIRHLGGLSLFTDFDYNEFRERDWANILVIARSFVGETDKTQKAFPLLVSYQNNGVIDILPQTKSKSNCTAICVSMCGNFGLLGFEDGSIEKVNMQSGIHKWKIEQAHNKAVIALKTDGINSMIISASLDGTIKFWDFFQSSPLKTIELSASPNLLEINRDSDLIALSTLNNEIKIIDKSSFKVVREFLNTSKLNDLVFTKDAKWLVTVGEDRSLKIYDIISGNIIEWVIFKEIPSSVTVSPNNQYIAISFVGLYGVYLWVNKSLFMELVGVDEVKSPIVFDRPFCGSVKIKKNRKDIYKINTVLNKTSSPKTKIKTKENLPVIHLCNENKNLIRLSKENKVKFRIINHLEKIQERNQPQIKQKEKSKAPFFLFNINNNLSEIDHQNDESQELLNIMKNYTHFKNDKTLKNKKDKKEMILTEILTSYKSGKIKSFEISKFLNSLNPYLVDLEIRNLDSIINSSTEFLHSFLNFILEEVMTKNNFELIQAYLNRFLKIFTDDLLKDSSLKKKVSQINELVQSSYTNMEDLYNNTMCLISHLGKIQI